MFSVRDLALKSGVSTRTLYKHRELWQSVQANIQKALELDCLESVVHQYNAGVVEECSNLVSLPLVVDSISVSSFLNDRQKKPFETQVALKASEGFEKEWRDRVACLLEINVLEEPLEKVKALVNVLSHLCLIAPCVEDSELLFGYINQMQACIKEREERILADLKSSELMGDPNSRFQSIKFLSF